MEYFPFCVPMLYHGPMNYAPAYWLPPQQTAGTTTGMSCHMVERGDNLDFCCGNYSVREVIELFGRIVKNWSDGLEHIEKINAALTVRSKRFMEEYYNAKCIYHVYKSTYNVFRVYELCRNWHNSMMRRYIEICESEIENCKRLLPLLRKDPRLGMHLECKGYMFDPDSVSHKVRQLEAYIENEILINTIC
jgi:hypothetical protein